MTRCSPLVLVLLVGLPLGGCSDPGDAIPPALAELHQRASAGDATAHVVNVTGMLEEEPR